MYYILNVSCSFVYYTRRMHFRVFKFSISVKVFVVKNSFFPSLKILFHLLSFSFILIF